MSAIPKEIVERVKARECILFLGAMASAAPPPAGCKYQYTDAPPTAAELSKHLAEVSGYPDEDKTNLQRVALYFEFRENGSRAELVNEIINQLENHTPSPALHMLAALPFPIIITTNYDRLFDQALSQAVATNGKHKVPNVIIYDPELHRVPDYVALDHPDEHAPVLVKLHGDIYKKESIVITEEDYLTFIHKMSDKDYHPLHENLRARLSNWHVLFIGYSLKDYNLRLLFRMMRWHTDVANFPLSFSVDPKPDNLIVSIWQRQHKPMVSFIKDDLWNFVPALYEACLGHPYKCPPQP